MTWSGYRPRLRPMISFLISAVPPKIDRALLSRQSHNRAGEHRGSALAGPRPELSSGQREPRRSRDVIWAAITRQGIISPRRSSPSRGVAPTTTPNQRPRISQPSTRTSTPSSSRHSRHRSSRCTIPATAARCGRAPASRRAAIRTSAGVSTLTTTAWARAAPDDHRDSETVVRRRAVTPVNARVWLGQLLAASPASGPARPADVAGRTGCVPGRSPPRPGRAGPTGPAG